MSSDCSNDSIWDQEHFEPCRGFKKLSTPLALPDTDWRTRSLRLDKDNKCVLRSISDFDVGRKCATAWYFPGSRATITVREAEADAVQRSG